MINKKKVSSYVFWANIVHFQLTIRFFLFFYQDF